MEFNVNLVLVDGDPRRRAAITHALSTSNIHVEPFESVGELAQSWPRYGIILLHNDDGAVARLIEAMADHGKPFPIIAFSEEPDAQKIVQAILDGAIDYVTWPIAGKDLAATLDRAERMGNAKLREVVARNRIEKLTQREREVLTGIASGLSNRLIGQRLAISPRTVEIHRANMLKRLGADHTSEAIRIAIEAGLA